MSGDTESLLPEPGTGGRSGPPATAVLPRRRNRRAYEMEGVRSQRGAGRRRERVRLHVAEGRKVRAVRVGLPPQRSEHVVVAVGPRQPPPGHRVTAPTRTAPRPPIGQWMRICDRYWKNRGPPPPVSRNPATAVPQRTSPPSPRRFAYRMSSSPGCEPARPAPGLPGRPVLAVRDDDPDAEPHQPVGRHQAGRAGADDQDVTRLGGHLNEPGPPRCAAAAPRPGRPGRTRRDAGSRSARGPRRTGPRRR